MTENVSRSISQFRQISQWILHIKDRTGVLMLWKLRYHVPGYMEGNGIGIVSFPVAFRFTKHLSGPLFSFSQSKVTLKLSQWLWLHYCVGQRWDDFYIEDMECKLSLLFSLPKYFLSFLGGVERSLKNDKGNLRKGSFCLRVAGYSP